MVIFKPFTGIRFAPTPTLGSQLSPPYDVISSQEQDALYQQHPHNIIRIDYGKTDPHIPPHETVYTRAHQQLSEWLQSGVLQRDSVPSFYVYRHTYALPNGSQKQLTGVIGALQLHPFDARQVIPHENTMPGPIQDRLTLTHHCQTNLSPIYTLVDDPDHGLDHCLDQLTQVDPDMNADTPSGRYELWVVKSKQGIQTIMGIMTPRPVVIADGHHRYTTALHYQAWARQQQGVVDAESDYTLAFVASAQNDGITIYPTHRGVYQTTFFESDDWLERIQSVFQVDTCPSADHFLSQPYPMGTMALMRPDSDTLWVLHAPPPEKVAPYFPPGTSMALQQLDVALLQHVILIGMMGMSLDSIAAKEGMRYYKAMKDLTADLDAHHIQAAFLMQSPPLSALTNICIHGEKMPQKSTYFYPKLITGLVMNPVNPLSPSYSIHQETSHEHTH